MMILVKNPGGKHFENSAALAELLQPLRNRISSFPNFSIEGCNTFEDVRAYAAVLRGAAFGWQDFSERPLNSL